MIDLQPDNSMGYHLLGGAYIAMARYDDAIEILKKGSGFERNVQRLEQSGVGLHVSQPLSGSGGCHEAGN